MLYLKTSVKNGIISLYPLNPDEMYYKCEVCGNFYGIDNLSDFSFDDVFLKDYICPQCEAENEEDYELEQEEEFQSRIEKALKMNNLIKENSFFKMMIVASKINKTYTINEFTDLNDLIDIDTTKYTLEIGIPKLMSSTQYMVEIKMRDIFNQEITKSVECRLKTD